MARIVRIDRLEFCKDEAELASAQAKGAGWVVRSSELRISAPAIKVRQACYERAPGHWIATITAITRGWAEREYRILRRKGVRLRLRRGIDALAQSLRIPRFALK